MTNQPTNNPPPGGKMTPKGKSVFAKLKNSAKRALHPSTKYDYSVVNAIAAVHVENLRILNRAGCFAPDGAIIDDSGENLGSHNGSQGGSKNSSATPRDQGPSNLASRDASDQSDSSSPTTTPSEETENTDHSLTAGSVSPNSVARQARPPTRQTTFFQNVPKPVFRVALPKAGHRFTSTLQLAFGQHLLSKNPSPSTSTSGLHVTSGDYVQELALVLDKAEKAWRSDVEKDSVEQDHVRWLVTRVATEFVNCANKDVESIAEVVLLGSVLDPKICHRLESEGLLDIYLLQGLMQLLQEALPGSLIDDDLVRILRVLREQLMKTYKALGDAEHAASDRIYRLSTIVCRVLDAMMEGDIRGLNRAEDHKPLLDLLVELKGSPDPYLKFQVSYAWQALQYTGDDEPPLHAVLRIGGGVIMAALSVSSVFKFDPENLFKGLDTLAQAAGQAFDVVKAGVEGAQALRKGGEGAMDSLLMGFRSGSKRAWYPALQAARMCVRDGRLADFQQVIYGAPCRRESEFQWGICQLLGEIAMDPIWAIENRQQAVDLLGKLYRSDKEWITDPGAKKAILGILRHISINTEQIIQDCAGILLQDLTTSSTSSLPRAYPLTVRMWLPAASPLLDKALKDLALEYELRRMMTRCREEYCQTVYIPPQAKANLLAADKESSPLMDKVEEFLSSNRQVFLVLGDSRAGKSTFNRHLERVLWKAYKPGDRIPLFIGLPALKNPEKELITEHLKNYDFSEAAMQELKRDRQFILICDGYDEARLSINLHSTNMFNRSQQWKVKMIFSCRSAYLGQYYRERFQPQPIDQYSPASPHLFQEAAIVPFSSSQIEDYVEQFVQETKVHELSDSRPVWSSKKYMDELKAIPNLMELVKNPCLLNMTRLYLYHAFINNWANLNMLRLMNTPLEGEASKTWNRLYDDGFVEAVIDFLKELAAAIFREQDGGPIVEYIHGRDRGSWKVTFFGNEDESRFLRESNPLARIGREYSFIHPSLLEYFYSRHVFDAEAPLDIARHPLSQRNLVKESSIMQFLAGRVHEDPTFKNKLHQVIELSKADSQASQAASNDINILIQAGLHFIGADLRGVRVPRANLAGGQFYSAQFQGADLTGANLTMSWIKRADFNSAQMADVQFGELPCLKVSDAAYCCAYSPENGRTFAVGLRNGEIGLYETVSWEQVCVLCGHKGAVWDIAYLPTGNQIVSGSDDSTVRIWNSQSGELCRTLEGHSKRVTCVAFSPNGCQIASSSQDGTVRIWTIESGETIVLSGHTKGVLSVTWPPSGHQPVSANCDGTMRLWNPETGVSILYSDAIERPYNDVWCVAYSPDGHRIVSAYEEGGLELWDAGTRKSERLCRDDSDIFGCMTFSPTNPWIAAAWRTSVILWDAEAHIVIVILNGLSSSIFDMAFSPDGQEIASCSEDHTVRRLEVNTGRTSLMVNVVPDPGDVFSVEYSSDGQHIISISSYYGGTVQQWEALTGAFAGYMFMGQDDVFNYSVMAFSPSGCQVAIAYIGDCDVLLVDKLHDGCLIGHTEPVCCLAYSPCGRKIASGSHDQTVRLWTSLDSTASHTLKGHTSSVTNVVFSPSGQLASGSDDRTIRLWDSDTSNCTAILEGHTKDISLIAYSPDSLRILVRSRDELRFWSAQSGRPGPILYKHFDRSTSIAYSPCDQWIASAGDDKTVRLWKVDESDQWSCAIVHHELFASVQSIAWNPLRRKEFITGGSDHSLRAWRVTDEDGDVLVSLLWSAHSSRLDATNAKFETQQ